MNRPDPYTLPLPFQNRTETDLASSLVQTAGRRVELKLTRNRSRMASFQREGGVIRVRLHEAFLDAEPHVLQALGRWISGKERNVPQPVREFIRNIEPVNDPGRNAKRNLQPVGQAHDLAALAAAVNEEYFEGAVSVDVTWGRDTSNKRVRHRRLGSFTHADRLIVIHPVLDHERVPEYVVSMILYHEMLHSQQPPEQKRVHDAAFRRAEQAHPDYERAERWLKRNAGLIHGGRRRRARP